MYSRGMSTREIQGHLEEIYGVEVSPALISEVSSAVQEEVEAWQHRPLESQQRWSKRRASSVATQECRGCSVRNSRRLGTLSFDMPGAGMERAGMRKVNLSSSRVELMNSAAGR
jgi:hypothetical protein